MKVLFQIFTAFIHWGIAVIFFRLTGIVGMILMVAHWPLFGGACCLSHIEKVIHKKFIGESWLERLDYEKTRFYKWTKFKIKI